MERFPLLYAIACAIMNSMENLRFDEEGYFYVLVFYTSYFIKEIENISPRVPIRYRNARGSLREFEIVQLKMMIILYANIIGHIIAPSFV